MSEPVPYLEPLILPNGAAVWAEEIAAAVWDRPSIETREEFVGALLAVFERLLTDEREACADLVRHGVYACSCHQGFTSRGLTDPDCFHCIPLAEAADEIRDRGKANVATT